MREVEGCDHGGTAASFLCDLFSVLLFHVASFDFAHSLVQGSFIETKCAPLRMLCSSNFQILVPPPQQPLSLLGRIKTGIPR